MPYSELIETLKCLFEKETGWGDSTAWTNHDFIRLSELIRERSGVTLSHVTLKRIWGKVKYDSLPNTYTLDALAVFTGFKDWRDFATVQQSNAPVANGDITAVPAGLPLPGKPANKAFWWSAVTIAIGLYLVVYLVAGKKPEETSAGSGYSFGSRKVVTSGLPNSVIFDFDARKAPVDSVVIQQSWDKTRQVKVSKNQRQHTSIYYFPDFYQAKLIVDNRIVKQHELLIKSNGWLPLVALQPVPVYFDLSDVMGAGKMSLSLAAMQARTIPMQPNPPDVWYFNVKDYGEIYSDNFTFETSLKNDYRIGAAVCQVTRIYLLCKGTAIWIPLCSKGCIASLDLYFTKFYVSGKDNDLSAFGVDFNNFVKLKVVSKSGKAQIFINDHFAYNIPQYIVRSKIIGIAYRFQGTGSVDYVKLGNGTVSYKDEF